MKILVTGGAGFIGSNFVRRTLSVRPNVEITILDALTYAGSIDNLLGLEGRYRFVEGDILRPELVDPLVAESDVVVHFAAESHNDNSLKSARPFVETNVMGTFELIQTCMKHDVRFHHISTDEVYGDLPLDSKEKFTPETPFKPSSPYSSSKAASDLLVRAWVRSFGLRATISNSSNNFGPCQHEEKLIPRTIKLIDSGQKAQLYGNGLNVRDWIHVDDHSDGVWAIIDRGIIGQTYLLGANNERSNLQVVQTILEALGKPRDWIDFLKDRPGHDLRYAIDASKTQTELGWKPSRRDFEKELGKVIPFYLKR
jgi:dTDP-glucose 4,6-dehydratase